jgi:carbon-monoxide dehydrogenase iron sulfur subunit
MGCRLCEVNCAVQHAPGRDVFKAFRGEKRPSSRMKVHEKGLTTLALQCRHCHDASCVTACLSGALRKDSSGTVVHEPERCVGCWTCILVCPFGAVRRDESEKKVVVKCDLCPHLEVPACVAGCPNEALILVETGE